MRRRLLIAYWLLVMGLPVMAATSTLDSLLSVLESEVGQSAVYTTRKQAHIDSLCAVRPMTQQLQLTIAREFQHFQSDSSYVWFLKLQKADEPIRSQAFIDFVKLLGSSGHYGNAIDMLKRPGRPSIDCVEGYKMAWLLYTDVASDTRVPTLRDEALEEAKRYYDAMMEALRLASDTSEEYLCWYEEYCAMEREDWQAALLYNQRLIDMVTPEDHLYAILAYGQATLYELAGDWELRREWLVRSAITDVRCGITDNGSSWIVAQDCFDADDFSRAYCFSDYSLTNATFFNAPTRFIQNFTPGHIIASRYEHELRRWSVRLGIVLLLLAVALAAMVIAVVYIHNQNKRLHALNRQLSAINHQLVETNKVKEQYICRYLEVYSDYIRRLTTMARRAGEKDPSAFMNREMDAFYRSFDDTFLSLYGNFVEEFNALLKPEARITPKPGERMTVEMRIFALIMLGIDSSAKIAELLCYSPNTISNYRVKIKNNALGKRDDFEARLRMIAI